jgi:cytochrome bd-type quinol oxidase subunit 1
VQVVLGHYIGLLPLLLSLFVLLRNWRDLLALPFWLTALAVMAAILWVIGWWAAEFRRRLQLYEFVLDEALHHQSAAASHACEHQESTA